ncbi:MAG TPA: hypothetical protein VLZ12_05760 [Verrucomicrobiae bacterium]|nr:hypothetical protein [Verrucomicrobiae bacterium]
MNERHSKIASLVLLVLITSSCQESTWVAQTVYYPQGSDSANAQYSLVIEVDGARGHAYVDRTTKTIGMTIWEHKIAVLDRQYQVTAGDLKWKVFWNTLNDLRIVFFEYGKPVPENETPSGFSKLARQVFTVAFTFDETTKQFVEAQVPAVVVEQIAEDADKENKRHTAEIYFDDSAENESRIIRVVKDYATKSSFQTRTPPVGEIGRLAEWKAEDLSIAVQRYDSLRQITVEIDDYSGHDFSTELGAIVRALPGVRKTRRTASVNFRAQSQDPEATVRIVESVAAKHLLNRTNRKGMFAVATFATDGLQLEVDYFESDGTMKVLIEDFGWLPDLAEVERHLRAALLERSHP